MKWVIAIMALSLLSLFSNATNSANLDGKVFSPFDKHFSPSYSLAGYDFGLSNRNNGLNCCYLCQPVYSVSKGFAQFSFLSGKEVGNLSKAHSYEKYFKSTSADQMFLVPMVTARVVLSSFLSFARFTKGFKLKSCAKSF